MLIIKTSTSNPILNYVVYKKGFTNNILLYETFPYGIDIYTIYIWVYNVLYIDNKLSIVSTTVLYGIHQLLWNFNRLIKYVTIFRNVTSFYYG